MAKKTVPVMVRMDAKLRERLKAAAAVEKRPVSNLIVVVMEDWATKREAASAG